MQKKCEVATNIAGDEEVLSHVLMPIFTKLSRKVGIGKQEPDLVCRALRGVAKHARLLVNDLCRNAANGRSDYGFLLPEPFRHCETETFSQAFLDDNRRSALQGVDLKGAPGRQIENVYVGVIPRCLLDFGEYSFSFRIVRSPAAGQDKLTIKVSLHILKSPDYPNRILQPIEAGDLSQDWAPGIDLEALKNFIHHRWIELFILF